MAASRYRTELSPYKVCVCVLIYESLANSAIHASARHALHSFLTSNLFRVRTREPSLQELLQSLDSFESSGLSLEGRESLSDSLSRALRDLEHCNDLIILFNSRLTELRSDAEINLGYMDEGGVLYLFLRKCLVAFAALDFEGLIRLFDRVKEYKAGVAPEDLPDSDVTLLVSHMAASLSVLCTQHSYSDLSHRISKLPCTARWLLQAHVDSYYGLPTAVDHLHRHFDQDLERTLPPASVRVAKNALAKSFTYYASLHRVKVELQLSHLETAVHLLVETVKRELSEGDSAAILESSLLFCRIAGVTGSWAQERSLSEKCVLRALEKKNPPAIILAALNCAQLDCIYARLTSLDISKAVAPKTDGTKKKKKTQTLEETEFYYDEKVTTATALRGLAMRTMVEANTVGEFLGQLLQTEVLTWLSEGNLTVAIAHFSILLKLQPQTLSHREDVQLAFSLIRESALHSVSQTQYLLSLVDSACPVKDCIEWEFTCDYVSGVWSLLQGKYEFVEFFERKMLTFAGRKLDKFYEFVTNLLKCERLLAEEKLQEAQVALTSLHSEATGRGWQHFQIATSLLQSEIYTRTCQHSKSLLEVLRCFPALKHSHRDKYAVYIHLADSLLHVYPNALKSLQVLHKIRPLLEEEAGELLQGRYFLSRAQCKLALSRSVGVSGNIKRSAVADMNEALAHFERVSATVEARSVYYLLARTFHETGQTQQRDVAAQCFNTFNAQLNLCEKETPVDPQLAAVCRDVQFPRVQASDY